MNADMAIADLEALENTVRRGMTAFIDVGTALKRIRDGHGYRLRGYDTFKDYCNKEFGFSLRHGQRFITSSDTAATVKALTGESIKTESAARALTEVVRRAEARAELFQIFDAIRAGGKAPAHATAKDIRMQLLTTHKGAGEAVKLVWPMAAPTLSQALVEHANATCTACTQQHEINCRFCPLVRFLQRAK